MAFSKILIAAVMVESECVFVTADISTADSSAPRPNFLAKRAARSSLIETPKARGFLARDLEEFAEVRHTSLVQMQSAEHEQTPKAKGFLARRDIDVLIEAFEDRHTVSLVQVQSTATARVEQTPKARGFLAKRDIEMLTESFEDRHTSLVQVQSASARKETQVATNLRGSDVEM